MAIKILHIIKDDVKFFEKIYRSFEQDTRINVDCILVVKKKTEAFKSIPPTDIIKVVEGKQEVKELFKSNSYNYVYFYSLPYEIWWVIDLIPKKSKIIWWSWGYELYEPIRGMKPFLPIQLYHPKTRNKLREGSSILLRLIQKLKILSRPYYNIKRNKILRRVDYFQPVIKEEYDLMSIRFPKLFRAKEFYGRNSWGDPLLIENKKVENVGKSVLLGNSATYTNNHVDVWDTIIESIENNQEIIIPLNYGDMDYARELSGLLKHERMSILNSFISREEYTSMLSRCGFFVLGAMRQQAVGNLLIAIEMGMSIFLYRDSILYKYLKKSGFSINAIEDVDTDSFKRNLSITDIKNNINRLTEEMKRRNAIYENILASGAIL